ncbi:MAG: glycosyl hydrolase [Bacteroidales bacterium]
MQKSAIFLFLILLAISGCQAPETPSGSEPAPVSPEEGFRDPPLQVRPKGYWDWINGNFDLERLTVELEKAKAQGMAGYDIFDIGAVSNPGDMVPAGPAFMGEECLEGIAHAVREAERLGMELGLILSSSWDAGGSWIKPEHGSMALYQSTVTFHGPGTFEGILPFPELPETGRGGKELLIEKDARGLPVFYRDVATLATRTDEQGIIQDLSRVIDLSDRMDPDGNLSWDAPEGKWKITRFVCTNTGEPLKVPSPNSTGRSMDHFSAEATDFHFNYFLDRLQDKLGDVGKTPIKYFYLCSYEVVGFVWTPGMLEEFSGRRGYDMKPYLPVLQGKIIQNEEITERFMYDYRKTLSDLLIENLYLRGRKIINPHGIELCSESGGPGAPIHNVPVDALRALGVLDIPRGEFWNKHKRYDDRGFDVMQLVKEISCAAHIYGKKEVQGESFTSFLHWQEGPADLKPLADRAMCEGLNRFVYHTCPHTTPDAGIPGYAYHAGTHFNTTRVWWPKSRAFTDYLARCCFLLQQGNFVGDVLYYYGDQAPNFVKPKHVDPRLGYGFDYDVTNSEVILTRIDAEDEKLVLPGGQSYEILVLPDQDHADVEVLTKLGELVKKGATMVGPKPSRSHGLKDYQERDRQVRELAGDLWGTTNGRTVTEHEYGKGKVIWSDHLRQVLDNRGIGPDFTHAGGSDSAEIDFIHRRTSTQEIYFVSNVRNGPETIRGTFRVSGMIPECWDPETGKIHRVALYSDDGTHTTIPFKLQQHGSIFFVFQKGEQADHFVEARFNGKEFTPELQMDGHDIHLIAAEEGTCTLVNTEGSEQTIESGNIPSPLQINGPWEIDFPEGWGAPDQAVFPELISWSQSGDPGIKYFSGIATYHRTIHLPEESISAETVMILDLGTVKEVAEVYVNGESLGILWKPPWRVDITAAARAGENILTIEVANTWNNRLVGDGKLPEPERFTKTNITGPNWQTRVPWEDSPLIESGLIGPVRIEFAKKLPVN